MWNKEYPLNDSNLIGLSQIMTFLFLKTFLDDSKVQSALRNAALENIEVLSTNHVLIISNRYHQLRPFP